MAALAEIVNEDSALTDDRFDREARRILRRLCERSAVLAVAADMDKAVVVRETEAGQNRTAVADREIAEALALKDWIACDKPGRIARYAITSAGRMALSHLVAKSENDAKRFSETEAAFCGDLADDEGETTGKRRVRYGVTETPMVLLSRRRDKDGERFLSSNLVRAGERLREDFEMAQIELDTEEGCDSLTQNWAEDDHDETVSLASAAAKKRVRHALRDLGPGLSDVVLRCCCYLQGLETIEKQMGWSARSGKIVLRIALQRLRRHYEDQGESAGMMG